MKWLYGERELSRYPGIARGRKGTEANEHSDIQRHRCRLLGESEDGEAREGPVRE